MCNVHGYTPYFYIPLPPDFRETDTEKFRKELDVCVHV